MSSLMMKPIAPSISPRPVLPQFVPSSACFRCDVCCRFPSSDSPLRPYFTAKEISRAVDGGIDRRAFGDREGCQITLVPDTQGEGFLCPAFDAARNACRIYERRPLDCQLYPLSMMWNAMYDRVVLGWDTKCPFIREQLPGEIRAHADQVMEILRQPDAVREVANHPRLVGNYQEDVIVLAPLAEITEALAEQWGPRPMHKLEVEDLSKLAAALDRSGLGGATPLAACGVASHYIWNGLLPYWWTTIHGAFCLFIQSPDGWFMPLPPLTDGPIDEPLAEAFQVMRRWNRGRTVSRIENVPASLAGDLRAKGYSVTPKHPDYLYRAADLAALAGDRYKSQRAMCNRAERIGTLTAEPYSLRDRKACRALFHEWERQKRTEGLDEYAALLIEDALPAHEVAWSLDSVLRLDGSVLRIDGQVRAYTFGYWLNEKTWCVLLEVADRTIPGLAQYLFRQTSRKALSDGAEFVNTMDDSGLVGLRLSKEAYHPFMKIHNFICSETPRA